MIALVVIAALSLDTCLGEVKKFHPLVGFGRLVGFIERAFYRKTCLAGLLSWALCVLPLTMIATLIGGNWLVDSVLLYLAIGRKSLQQHAQAVFKPLHQGDLVLARTKLSYIVSRDCDELNQTGIAKATVESVLENGNDSTFAVLFWYVLAGAPGVVLYRLANTLDAMWGYRNSRYSEFGYSAAKIDDMLNYLPARLVALTYAVLGNFSSAMDSWRTQAPLCDSPNAGTVMASGAGALQIRLGGEYKHGGQTYQKPILGTGSEAEPNDIDRAIDLVNYGVLMWAVILAGFSLW